MALITCLLWKKERPQVDDAKRGFGAISVDIDHI
jgi:hypothetical protein